ncbi:haloacid dehalogenase-like hydrolase superfamily protein [Striga asiatica]|uniref:Haloacid dehalogenase-like hydrolase superfamily protein n=1 Tax=Striga asiatica TaxID=4170 RepID=A0A5A7R6Y5_STRAF|nr:haloacid dehalogenase-like hydrolase superfamily protein [Striga asiatica]
MQQKKNSAFTEKKWRRNSWRLKTKKSNPTSNIDAGAFSHGGFLGGAAHPLLPADPNPESVHPHSESSSPGRNLLRCRYLPAPTPGRLAARLPQSRRCLQKVDFSILGKSDGRSVTDLCIISLLLLSTREPPVNQTVVRVRATGYPDLFDFPDGQPRQVEPLNRRQIPTVLVKSIRHRTTRKPSLAAAAHRRFAEPPPGSALLQGHLFELLLVLHGWGRSNTPPLVKSERYPHDAAEMEWRKGMEFENLRKEKEEFGKRRELGVWRRRKKVTGKGKKRREKKKEK